MALHEFDYDKEPTVAIVKKILSDSIKLKATDIHFDPRGDHLSVKFRLNGDLQEYTTAPENVKVNIITRIKILAGMNITETTNPQIGSIHFESENVSQNMRVSTLPIVEGEKVVVHLSNYAMNIKNIDKLGINKDNLKKLKDLIKENSGLLLITGTTGSGKTTTLYSILKELNNKSSNIISIEEPIKMKLEGINQVELNPDKGITLKNVLHNILLQDPNIISISELYDDETARSAIRTAITGKLVISTMQTKSVYQTIDTLLNMDVENYLLGSYLNGIISQRIIKKLCPSCRDKRPATKYEKTIIKKILHKDVDELYYAEGCEDCRNGYIRQIPITEIVILDDELRNAISNNKDHSLIRKAIYESNKSIIQDGLEKAIAGDTSFDEIMRVLDIKVDLTDEDEELKQIILGNVNDEELDKINNNEGTKSEEPKEEKDVVPVEETPTEETTTEETKEETPTEEPVKEEEPKEEKNVAPVSEEPKEEKATDVVEEPKVDNPPEEQKIEPTVTEEPKEEPAPEQTDNKEITPPVEETPAEETKEEEITPIKIDIGIAEDNPPEEEPKEEQQVEETKEEPTPSEDTKAEDVPAEETNEDSPVTINIDVPVETEEEPKTNDPVPFEEAAPTPTGNQPAPKPEDDDDDDDEDDDDDFNYGDGYSLQM